MMRGAATILLVCAGALSWTAVASAADDERETATTAALQKFDEGRKALEASDFVAALAAFDASNRLLASPNSLLYMARCYKALGRTASAYTTFRVAYSQSQDRLVATGDKRYVATRDTAAQEAATIEADVPKLAIVLSPEAVTPPNGFVVKQNGNDVAPSTWGTAVATDPGHITIDATGPRIEPFHDEVDLALGETKRVDVRVSRVPTSTLAVKLKSRPLGLAIRVDGVDVDSREISIAPREVDPGVHTIDATAPGYLPFHWQRITVDNEAASVDLALVTEPVHEARSRKGTPAWMFYTAGGAAIATLATASILAVHAYGRKQDEIAKNQYIRDPGVKDGISSEATVANVFFITGAILGVGAVALAFTTEWKRTPKDTPSTGKDHVLHIAKMISEGTF